MSWLRSILPSFWYCNWQIIDECKPPLDDYNLSYSFDSTITWYTSPVFMNFDLTCIFYCNEVLSTTALRFANVDFS